MRALPKPVTPWPVLHNNVAGLHGAGLPATPLDEVLERWILAFAPAPLTVKRYRGGLRRLAEAGILTVADACDRQKVARFYEARRELAEASTANTDVTAVTVLLEYLEQVDGTLPDGTTASIRRVRRRPKRVRKLKLVFLEQREAEAIARAAAEIHPMLELAVLVAYWSGMRSIEFRRLRGENLDLGEKPVIRVLWEVDELGQEGTIKTRREREVPVEAPLKKLLLERVDGPGFVFRAIRRHSHGKDRILVSEDWLRRNLKKAARKAGVTRVKIDWMLLRRSCACRWINSGKLTEDEVAEAMGHTPEIFRRYYRQMRGGYSEKFETTKVHAHASEQETHALKREPPGRTPTKTLTKSDVARLQAAERALLKKRERERS